MVFKGLSIHIAEFHSQSRTGGGGLIRETKIPVQELWLRMGGGAYTREGAYSRDTTVVVNMNRSLPFLLRLDVNKSQHFNLSYRASSGVQTNKHKSQ